MSARLFHTAFHRAFTASGVPSSGEKLHFYLSGGTTATPVYSDEGLSIPLPNPVVADSAGRFPAIYLNDTISYRVVQETAGGSPVNDVDPYEWPTTLTTASILNIIEAALVEGSNIDIARVLDTFVITADLSAAKPTEAVIVPIFDTPTTVAAGVAKFKFRMPYAFTVTAVRASLATVQTSGSILTVDINSNGTTFLTTKLTIDNTEATSTTAATPPVMTGATVAIPDDAEITFDVDQIGDGTAKGLNVTIIGHRT